MRNKIVFVGRSNVGKSSTIRALTGAKLRIGRKPGATLREREIKFGNYIIVDMPGFGFMQGVSKKRQDEIKDFIVRYLERRRNILFAVQITDAKAFAEIARRWSRRGHIPVEIEMFNFLREIGLEPILVANKIDKIPRSKRKERFDEMHALLGLPKRWGDLIPFSAKTGEGLKKLKQRIMEKALRKIFNI